MPLRAVPRITLAFGGFISSNCHGTGHSLAPLSYILQRSLRYGSYAPAQRSCYRNCYRSRRGRFVCCSFHDPVVGVRVVISRPAGSRRLFRWRLKFVNHEAATLSVMIHSGDLMDKDFIATLRRLKKQAAEAERFCSVICSASLNWKRSTQERPRRDFDLRCVTCQRAPRCSTECGFNLHARHYHGVDQLSLLVLRFNFVQFTAGKLLLLSWIRCLGLGY